jgi:hypothetical protein
MTEVEWLACIEPMPMVHQLHESDRASERKLRLFACAWGYDLWLRLPDQRSRDALAVAERFADNLVGSSELALAFDAARIASDEVRLQLGGRQSKGIKSQQGNRTLMSAAEVATNATASVCSIPLLWDVLHRVEWSQSNTEGFTLACYLRDIFGNPFRPVIADPRWLTSNVTDLARTIYDERAFDRLPILADALMDAGCADEAILSHCRSEGPHVRGCWVVDLVLGKT